MIDRRLPVLSLLAANYANYANFLKSGGLCCNGGLNVLFEEIGDRFEEQADRYLAGLEVIDWLVVSNPFPNSW